MRIFWNKSMDGIKEVGSSNGSKQQYYKNKSINTLKHEDMDTIKVKSQKEKGERQK